MFISRLINYLRSFPQYGHHKINEDVIKDIKWWQSYMPQFNRVSIIWLNEYPEPDQYASSDACLTSAGGFSQSKYYHVDFPDFILWEEYHISQLEMLTVVVTVKVWANDMKDKKKITFACCTCVKVRVGGDAGSPSVVVSENY